MDIEGFKYLKLPDSNFPMEGASVKDLLLARKSYADLLELAKEYFSQQDGGKQMEGLIFILRGTPGQLVVLKVMSPSVCPEIIPCFLKVLRALCSLGTLEHSILHLVPFQCP